MKANRLIVRIFLFMMLNISDLLSRYSKSIRRIQGNPGILYFMDGYLLPPPPPPEREELEPPDEELPDERLDEEDPPLYPLELRTDEELPPL
jgi:hypothetical protein